jgi:hypothetical protein
MVLNLMILNDCAFNPGLGWIKNTLPLLAIRRTKVVITIRGDRIANKIKVEMKSTIGLKVFQ